MYIYIYIAELKLIKLPLSATKSTNLKQSSLTKFDVQT